MWFYDTIILSQGTEFSAMRRQSAGQTSGLTGLSAAGGRRPRPSMNTNSSFIAKTVAEGKVELYQSAGVARKPSIAEGKVQYVVEHPGKAFLRGVPLHIALFYFSPRPLRCCTGAGYHVNLCL